MLRLAGRVLILGLLPLCSSCERSADRNARRTDSSVPPPVVSDDSLLIIARPSRAVFSSPDSLEIEVSLQNVGEDMMFLDDADRYSFELWSPEGRRIDPIVETIAQRSGRGPIQLRRGEKLTHTFNLACAGRGLTIAYPSQDNNECYWHYAIVAPGRYRLAVAYRRLLPPAASPYRGSDVMSDTIPFEFRPTGSK
jgi:hypothetical protein